MTSAARHSAESSDRPIAQKRPRPQNVSFTTNPDDWDHDDKDNEGDEGDEGDQDDEDYGRDNSDGDEGDQNASSSMAQEEDDEENDNDSLGQSNVAERKTETMTTGSHNWSRLFFFLFCFFFVLFFFFLVFFFIEVLIKRGEGERVELFGMIIFK